MSDTPLTAELAYLCPRGCTSQSRPGVCAECASTLWAPSRFATRVREQERSIATLTTRAEQAEAFKAYVHQRLDEANIPTHPDGPHSAAGCRIGDRLDIVLGRVAELEAALTEQGLLQKRADGSMVWHVHDCPASFDFAQCNYRCRVARAALGEKP